MYVVCVMWFRDASRPCAALVGLVHLQPTVCMDHVPTTGKCLSTWLEGTRESGDMDKGVQPLPNTEEGAANWLITPCIIILYSLFAAQARASIIVINNYIGISHTTASPYTAVVYSINWVQYVTKCLHG